MKFKFNQWVEVQAGFFKGLQGEVRSTYGWGPWRTYVVKLNTPDGWVNAHICTLFLEAATR